MGELVGPNAMDVCHDCRVYWHSVGRTLVGHAPGNQHRNDHVPGNHYDWPWAHQGTERCPALVPVPALVLLRRSQLLPVHGHPLLLLSKLPQSLFLLLALGPRFPAPYANQAT